MAKTANQKMKILYVMKILLEKTDCEHTLTVADIIDELTQFDIPAERKSIYDDIELLRLYGINIETVKNKTVGYYVKEHTFKLPELKLLVDAVQSSKFITCKKSMELIKKMESLTSKYEAASLHRQVYVVNRVKTMNESIYLTIDYIQSAILNNGKISFKYFEWNKHKEKVLRHNRKTYVVSPWALTWDDENYYLIAYDSEADKIKHYRVDKMMSLLVLEEKREGQSNFKGFDMAVYSRKTFSMFGGNDELVTLSCHESMAGVIIDRFGRDVTFFNDGDDRFIVTVKVAVSPHFLTWLMNFGTNIKIVSPQSVIDQCVNIAKTAIDQYGG